MVEITILKTDFFNNRCIYLSKLVVYQNLNRDSFMYIYRFSEKREVFALNSIEMNILKNKLQDYNFEVDN